MQDASKPPRPTKAAINSRQAQDEIIANLQGHDLIKARIVLDHFSRLESGAQRRILYELNRHGNTMGVSLMAYLLVTDRETADLYPDVAASIADKVANDPRLLCDLLTESGVVQGYFIQLAGRLRLAAAVPVLVTLLAAADPDLQVHSLHALLAIGDESAASPIRKLIACHPKDATVRFAAFEALAGLPVCQGDYIWASGLLDPAESVRLVAARAIDRHLDDLLAAGIRNIVKHGDKDAVQVVRAVLDSQARNIVLDLMRHGIGLDLISDHLTTQARPELKRFFVQLLAASPEAGQGLGTAMATALSSGDQA